MLTKWLNSILWMRVPPPSWPKSNLKTTLLDPSPLNWCVPVIDSTPTLCLASIHLLLWGLPSSVPQRSSTPIQLSPNPGKCICMCICICICIYMCICCSGGFPPQCHNAPPHLFSYCLILVYVFVFVFVFVFAIVFVFAFVLVALGASLLHAYLAIA